MDASSTAAVAAALANSRAASAFSVLSVLALEHLPQMSRAVGAAAAGVCWRPTLQPSNLRRSSTARSAPHQAAGLQAPPTRSRQHTGNHPATAEHQDSSGFTGDQLVSLLQALASLCHHDPKPLLEAACTCLLRSPQRSLAHVAALAHTCALLNHFHQPLFDTAVQMAQHAMQQQQEGGSDRALASVLAQLSWACGVTQISGLMAPLRSSCLRGQPSWMCSSSLQRSCGCGMR